MRRKTETLTCDRCGCVETGEPSKDWSIIEVYDLANVRAIEFQNIDKAPGDMCPVCRWALTAWWNEGRKKQREIVS